MNKIKIMVLALSVSGYAFGGNFSNLLSVMSQREVAVPVATIGTGIIVARGVFKAVFSSPRLLQKVKDRVFNNLSASELIEYMNDKDSILHHCVPQEIYGRVKLTAAASAAAAGSAASGLVYLGTNKLLKKTDSEKSESALEKGVKSK